MIVLEPGLRSRLGGVAIVVALTTAGVVFFGVGTGPRVLSPPAVPGVPSTTSPETVTVHVSGAVADPGLVEVAVGARTADAIAAAGGTTQGADLSAINLAASVRNGDQLFCGLQTPKLDLASDIGATIELSASQLRSLTFSKDGKVTITPSYAGEIAVSLDEVVSRVVRSCRRRHW